MKLQFDANKSFQPDAVAAVTDLFDGRPQGAPEYAVINKLRRRFDTPVEKYDPDRAILKQRGWHETRQG